MADDRVRRLAVVGLLFVGVLGAACGPPAPSASSTAKAYPLPSDGWKTGDGSLLAAFFGPFDAGITASGACAWLGSHQEPVLWPAGYRVRFNPTELIGPKGQVLAKAGEVLHFAGGVLPTGAEENRCGVPGAQTVLIMSPPLHRAG